MRPITILLPIIILLTIILFFILASLYFEKTHLPSSNIKYGVSFTPSYAQNLGLDWQKTYLDILENLKVKYLRLPTYWNILESNPDQFDFKETDFMLESAGKFNAKVLLVVGAKQPRWPECHIPNWALNLSVEERQKRILLFITKVIERYRNNTTIWGWQMENEPFFGFGENCDMEDSNFLKSEVEFVRSLDTKRPIIITDTGEWRLGIKAMQLSNIFGISLYRNAYNPIIGYQNYPFPPFFYYLKTYLVRKFFAPNNQKTIIAELQAEPWTKQSIVSTPINEQLKLLPLEKMIDNIEFAKKTSFDEMYLWGIEWWYFMKEHGHPEYWEKVKGIF